MLDLHDVVVTGVASRAASDAKPERWAFQPVRLARLDRASALAIVAADAALLDAGLGAASIAERRWIDERVALVVGTALGCHATNEEFYRGLLAEGARGSSPRLFAATLPSTTAGEISIHYGIRGPVETLTSGAHAGLEAIGRAAMLCAEGRVDVAIALAVDVGGPAAAALGLEVAEGAVGIVFERESCATARGARFLARPTSLGAAFSAGRPLAALEALLVESRQPRDTLAPPPDDAGAFRAAARLADRLHDGSGGLLLAGSTDPSGCATLLVFAG